MFVQYHVENDILQPPYISGDTENQQQIKDVEQTAYDGQCGESPRNMTYGLTLTYKAPNPNLNLSKTAQ